ncbi:MAG: hypothetical protein J6V50_04715, partial [Clostridia bacterium]|nr:hypothetical protein [Clostridia bacterium]
AVAVSAVFAFLRRHNAAKCIAAITLGTLFATFLFVIPTDWVKEGKEVASPALYSVISSLLYSLKAISGRQDIAQIESIALTGVLKSVYIYTAYIMFALSPVLASSLIISFIGDTGEKIRFYLSFSKKCYIFSEINENSLALAKTLKDEKKKTLVFCNAKGADKNLISAAKALGGITLYAPANKVRLSKRFKKYEFCFLSENEDGNLRLAEDFILRKDSLQKYDISINAFVKSGANIEVLESILSKKPLAVFDGAEEILLQKAATIKNESPATKLVFFGVSDRKELEPYFSENDDITIYNQNLCEAELDESFKNYNITGYYPVSETDDKKEKRKIKSRGLGFKDGRLVLEWQDEPLKIRFIDEIALFCNFLLAKHPLYSDLKKDSAAISVLLVGCGRLGTQMLKTVSWYGQIDGYTLKIRVLDKKATKIKKEILAECPEMEKYGIEFIDVDIESSDFEEVIKAFDDTTFVCVATGLDDLNIRTADNIYRIMRRHYSGYTPPIFSRVRKNIQSANFSDKGSYLKDRKTELFGTTESLFKNETLFNSELESLAFAVHLCYNFALSAPRDSFDYKKALHDFYTSEYSRRSSLATALHISAKLKSCGIDCGGILPSDDALSLYEEALLKDETKLRLIKNEHQRWNAFVRSEGFCAVDFENVKKYAPETRSHKDEKAKMHPCITEWEELDDLQAKYNELQQALNLKPSDFKEFDRKIVTEIPEIVRRAKTLSKEGW